MNKRMVAISVMVAMQKPPEPECYFMDIRREALKPEWLMQPVQQNHLGRKKKGRISKW